MTQVPTNMIIALFPLAQPIQGKSAVMPVDGAAAEPFADAFATLLTAGQESLPQAIAAGDLAQADTPEGSVQGVVVSSIQPDDQDTESVIADAAIVNVAAGMLPSPIENAPLIATGEDPLPTEAASAPNISGGSFGEDVAALPAGTVADVPVEVTAQAQVESDVTPIVAADTAEKIELPVSTDNDAKIKPERADVPDNIMPNVRHTQDESPLPPAQDAKSVEMPPSESSTQLNDSTIQTVDSAKPATVVPNGDSESQVIGSESGVPTETKPTVDIHPTTHSAARNAHQSNSRFSAGESAKDIISNSSAGPLSEAEARAIQDLMVKGERKIETSTTSDQDGAVETATGIETMTLPQGDQVTMQQVAAEQGAEVEPHARHKAKATKDAEGMPATMTVPQSSASTSAKNTEELRLTEKATLEVSAIKSVDSAANGKQVNLVSHHQSTTILENTQASAPPDTRPFTIETPKPIQVPGQVRVRIDPPEFGYIRVDLTSSANGVIGTMRIRSDQTRDIIERHIGDLHKSLADAGVRVERFEIVGVSRSTAKQAFNPNTPNQNQHNGHASQQRSQFTASGQHGRHRQDDAYKQPAVTHHRAPQATGVSAASGINLFA